MVPYPAEDREKKMHLQVILASGSETDSAAIWHTIGLCGLWSVAFSSGTSLQQWKSRQTSTWYHKTTSTGSLLPFQIAVDPPPTAKMLVEAGT